MSSASDAPGTFADRLARLAPFALALLVFALAAPSILFTRELGRIAAIWPVNAVALVVVIHASKANWGRYLLGAFAGAFAANLALNDAPLAALALAACNLLEIGLAAWLIRRFAGEAIDLGRQRHLLVFLGAALFAPLLSGAAAAVILSARHHTTYLSSVRDWFAADALGLLLVTPVLMALTRESLGALGVALRRPQGWLSAFILAATLTLVFAQNVVPVYFLIPAALTLVAFQLDLAGVAFSLLITAAAGVMSVLTGYGSLANVRHGMTEQLSWLQVFMVIMIVSVLPVAAELAKRRRLEASLRESNRLSGLAQQIAGIGYWRNDMVSGERTWSEQVFAIHGLKASDFEGMPPNGIDLYDSDGQAKIREMLVRATTTGASFDMTLKMKRADDGRERIVAYKGEAERDHTGAVRAVFGVLRDVTEEETARQRIEKSEIELRAARDAAEDAAAAKSLFLANMTHEIRTPLTSILGFANLLAGQPELNEMARTRVARVVGAGEALLSVVNDVLDFSKLEAGQFEILPRVVSPGEVLSETLLMFSPQAEAKGLSLASAADDLPAWVSLDPDRLRQILINLIGNAIKFTDAGSVRLIASYDTASRQLTVRVEDTGAGMTKAQQTKLFQRFSQVDASSTRRHGGTGLGLAISKGLAEAMGGTIGVESRVGSGSVFRFSLSAPIAEAPVCEPQGDEVGAGLEGIRVLVVDDNPMNRELARAVLEPFGAEISEACDGLTAVEAAAMPVDVILMDIRMPNLDGPAALARIRAGDGPNRNGPILAFTADAHVAALGQRGGFDGIVRKPIEPLALAQAIFDAAQGAQQTEPTAKTAAG